MKPFLVDVVIPELFDILPYFPSIAASNDLIVSSGLSKRALVGFDRSGSAIPDD